MPGTMAGDLPLSFYNKFRLTRISVHHSGYAHIWPRTPALSGLTGCGPLFTPTHMALLQAAPTPSITVEGGRRGIGPARVEANPCEPNPAVSPGVGAGTGWLRRTSLIMNDAHPIPGIENRGRRRGRPAAAVPCPGTGPTSNWPGLPGPLGSPRGCGAKSRHNGGHHSKTAGNRR
jgi:hypothetical protein